MKACLGGALVMVVAAGCAPEPAAEPPPEPTPEPPEQELDCPSNQLRDELHAADGELRVIVTLAVDTAPEAELAEEEIREQRAAINAAQEQLIDQLADTEAEVVRRFERYPQLVVRVDEQALCHLLRADLVDDVTVDEPEPPA